MNNLNSPIYVNNFVEIIVCNATLRIVSYMYANILFVLQLKSLSEKVVWINEFENEVDVLNCLNAWVQV